MPTQKIIITLSNSEEDPDNIQLHVDVEDKGDAQNPAAELLNESAAHMCALFVESIQEEGAQSLLQNEQVQQA